ncbi:hypothetical protein [Pantoea endophytica]|uniref:hypothetical protein n=1 Tax=Pantoea endophytica TaxID=92488 RepID=UPI00130478D9|nr:hypothetical protein [Pantoea endophytica]
MTQVIHGLPREELLQEVFRNSSVSEAVKKIVTQARAERDSRSEKGGKSKTKGGF